MVILLLNLNLKSTAQEMFTHIQKVWELDKINHHLFSCIHVDHAYKYAEHSRDLVISLTLFRP